MKDSGGLASTDFSPIRGGSHEPASINLLSLCWADAPGKGLRARKKLCEASDLGQTEAALEKTGKERQHNDA
jgi:hypothetical protein